MRPQWIFFDVGNVLFNDDPQAFHSYRFFHREFAATEPQLTFAELLAEREAEASRLPGFVLKRIAQRRLGESRYTAVVKTLDDELTAAYDANHLVNEHVSSVLRALRERYRLGILANQTPECRASLARRGLLPLFDVVAISQELDLNKPASEIFEWAVQQAGCSPSEAVMIGDRLDNDIAPAQQLGWSTVQMVWGGSHRKNWQPDDPQAREFLASTDRVAVFPSTVHDVAPDAVVASFQELAALFLMP